MEDIQVKETNSTICTPGHASISNKRQNTAVLSTALTSVRIQMITFNPASKTIRLYRKALLPKLQLSCTVFVFVWPALNTAGTDRCWRLAYFFIGTTNVFLLRGDRTDKREKNTRCSRTKVRKQPLCRFKSRGSCFSFPLSHYQAMWSGKWDR